MGEGVNRKMDRLQTMHVFISIPNEFDAIIIIIVVVVVVVVVIIINL
jgi:hypothetical protein